MVESEDAVVHVDALHVELPRKDIFAILVTLGHQYTTSFQMISFQG